MGVFRFDASRAVSCVAIDAQHVREHGCVVGDDARSVITIDDAVLQLQLAGSVDRVRYPINRGIASAGTADLQALQETDTVDNL